MDELVIIWSDRPQTEGLCLRRWSAAPQWSVLSLFHFTWCTSDFQFSSESLSSLEMTLWLLSASVMDKRLSTGNWSTTLWHGVGTINSHSEHKQNKRDYLGQVAKCYRDGGGLQLPGHSPGQQTRLEMQHWRGDRTDCTLLFAATCCISSVSLWCWVRSALQQHQSQGLIETEQTDEEGWLETTPEPPELLPKLLNILDNTVHLHVHAAAILRQRYEIYELDLYVHFYYIRSLVCGINCSLELC